jgi:hypothetical protein
MTKYAISLFILFILSLFNDTFSTSGHLKRQVIGYLVNNSLEKTWKEVIVTLLQGSAPAYT